MVDTKSKTEKFDSDYWEEELRHAMIQKENSYFFKSWELYERMYRYEFEDDILPYGIHYALGRVTVANTYGGTPYINAVPKRPEFAPFSRVVESAANHFVAEHEVADNYRSIALDGFIYGVGFNETGFLPAELSGIKEMKRRFLGTKKVKDISFDTTVSPGMPWEKRIHPRDFLVAYGTRRLYRARWSAVLVTELVEDLKDTDGFKKDKIKPTSVYGTQEAKVHSEREAEDKFTKYWRIHCARTKKIYYLSYMDRHQSVENTAKPEFIRDPEDDHTQIDGLPQVALMFNDDPRNFWMTPDSAILEPFANELTEIKTQLTYHRALAILRFFISVDAIEKEDLDKLINNPAEIGGIIRVKDIDKLSDAIEQFTPNIPSDQLIQVFEHSRSTLREIFGASRNTMGEVSTGRRTAQEINIAASQQSLRFDERREVMAHMIEMTVRKKLQYCFKYWGKEQILPVLGYEGAVTWVKFNPKELSAEFQLRVDSETLSPVTKKLERQETLELLGVLQNFPGLNIVPILKRLVQNSNWFDVMQLLPQANPTGEPVALSQFQDQQRGVLESGEGKLGAFVS